MMIMATAPPVQTSPAAHRVADLHLPLGSGNLDLRKEIGALKRCGYDGTITLEVFTPDKHFLAYSRDVLRRVWDEGE